MPVATEPEVAVRVADASRAANRTRRGLSPYAIVAVFVLAACVAHAIWMRTPVFPVDDAYITIHNAQVLDGMPERNFPGTPALTGSTSAIHTALVAALMSVATPLWAGMIAQYIGLLLFALATVRLVRATGLANWWAYLFVAVSAGVGGMLYQLFGGLETSLAMAGVCFALSLVASANPGRLLMVTCGLLPFLRPELAAFSLLLVAAQVYRRVRNHDGFRAIGLDVAVCAASTLPVLALLWWNTGALLPNTVMAKKYYFAEAFLPSSVKLSWMRLGTETFAIKVGPLLAGLLFLAGDELGLFVLSFVPLFFAAYYLQFPGALTHLAQQGNRYLYILLPMAVWSTCRALKSRTTLTRVVAIVLVTLTAANDAWTLRRSWAGYVEGCDYTRRELYAVKEFCERTMPPSSRLLIHDAGYLPFATGFQMVDLVGLKTPSAVPIHKQLTYPTGGKKRADAIHQIAVSTAPQYLVVLSDWERIFHIAEGLRKNGWTLIEIRGHFHENNRFRFGKPEPGPVYLVYQLKPPEGVVAAQAQSQGR
jgi:hypothetical protein